MHLATAKQTASPACLVVTGRSNSRKYRHLAKKLNVHRKIVFLGKVRHIQNALSITDVAALPTFYDPSSRFILEALAAAKPVITTRFNGATDLFVDGRHGKVIDTPENTRALADAISFFTDVNNIQKASDAVVADNLSEKISITRAAQQLISLYESIIEKRRQQ
jgi:UDP-glucose:(heptosyl)LPS alpha-1,3-glucosyltransferase